MKEEQKANQSLEKRVLEFLQTRQGAESIDRLQLTVTQRNAEKADFFLASRSVICEVKSLQSDTKAKAERLMKPVFESEHAPVFFGSWNIEGIFKTFPDGEMIKRDFLSSITSAIQTIFRKANRQIRTTKDVFGLPSAEGALVIANDMVEMLSPELISWKIGELFRNPGSDGKGQFPHINVVWVICETHYVEVSLGMKAFPALILARDGKTKASELIDQLQSEWASVHGMPMIEANPAAFETAEFKPERSEEQATTNQIPRHELWRRQYRQNPYLRHHNEEEIGEYYQCLMAALAPGFFRGASDEKLKLSMQLTERFTHLIDELNAREIGFEKYASRMQSLGAKMREGKTPSVEMAEIERLSKEKKNVLIAGQFYTNSSGEFYRCIKVEHGTAVLVFMAMMMGKTLDAVIGVSEHNWKYYWPLRSASKISALSKRFDQLVAKNPALKDFKI